MIITNSESFANLKNWIHSIKEDGNLIQMIIVGNKSDLDDQRTVTKEEAIKYAEKENIDYIETSSKTGENIQKVITLLCEKILDNTNLSKDFSFTLDSASFKRKKRHKCCTKE